MYPFPGRNFSVKPRLRTYIQSYHNRKLSLNQKTTRKRKNDTAKHGPLIPTIRSKAVPGVVGKNFAKSINTKKILQNSVKPRKKTAGEGVVRLVRKITKNPTIKKSLTSIIMQIL